MHCIDRPQGSYLLYFQITRNMTMCIHRNSTTKQDTCHYKTRDHALFPKGKHCHVDNQSCTKSTSPSSISLSENTCLNMTLALAIDFYQQSSIDLLPAQPLTLPLITLSLAVFWLNLYIWWERNAWPQVNALIAIHTNTTIKQAMWAEYWVMMVV